jgi:hypothetical protein
MQLSNEKMADLPPALQKDFGEKPLAKSAAFWYSNGVNLIRAVSPFKRTTMVWWLRASQERPADGNIWSRGHKHDFPDSINGCEETTPNRAA